MRRSAAAVLATVEEEAEEPEVLGPSLSGPADRDGDQAAHTGTLAPWPASL